ncbi:MAG: hypothetical protein NTW79_04050 [Candidatus Berkelbacteria bacterium]|nr:hypothetical protein [Candidatus Berkelbacteria bacterium]
MNISNIFNFYDKWILGISPGVSGLISLAILLLLAFSLWRFVKGNFIWIILVIIFIPATWPALKSIARILIFVSEFLILRVKLR